MNDTRTRASWLVYALGALCAAAIVAAILVVGPASGSQTAVTRTAKVATGVVQSTVSGSGNVQASSQLNLGFNTTGTVTHIYVTQGQHVVQGQLLATLDPQSAEVTLEQAKATLQSAEASLAQEEETGGESSSSAGGSGGSAKAATASTASLHARTATSPAPQATTTPTSATTPTSTTPAAPTATTPTTTTQTTTKPSNKKRSTTTSGESSTGGSSSSSPTSTTTSTISAATKEANLASARAAVKSEKLTVQSDEQAVQDTELYAPEDGTIVSLSGQVGEVVSGSGTTRSSSSAAGSSASSSGAATAGASASRSTTATGSSSSGSSSSSNAAFAILSDLSSMELVVPLSESEIGNVKVGQIATVTVEALEGRKLAAHVSEVSTLSTSNSGVVSYDVTFTLDQLTSGLKPGMSASAEVVVKQAQGINVPSSAITANTVTVVRNGKDVRQRVVAGLAGNSSTIVLSGLKTGETVVLPTVSTTSSSSSSSRRSALGGGVGAAAGGAGGGAGFPGGGGAALFRGGG
jgi:multidrug efflux pump subunit AcrA (membrane-fusion protein)